MNTTETNKKLAEFLGWKKPVFGNGLSRQYDYELPSSIELYGENELHYCSDCGNDLHLLDGCYTKDLRFHNDWNWLMLVVEKIEDLNYSIEINKQEENDYQCLVVKKDILIQEFSKTKIEAVYNACSMFVDWYNQNKLKNND